MVAGEESLELLLEAALAPRPFAAWLDGVLAALAAVCGAEGAEVEARWAGADCLLARWGQGGAGQGIPGASGLRLRLLPAERLEGPARRWGARALALIERELERARQDAQAARLAALAAAVAHEANNALLPLMSGEGQGQAEAVRVSEALEMLRLGAGRPSPRGLLAWGALLERLAALLGRGGGGRAVELELDPAVARWAFAPAQREVYAGLLAAGLTLRELTQAALRLTARRVDERLELSWRAPAAALPALVAALAPPRAPQAEARWEVAGDEARLTWRVQERPWVVLVAAQADPRLEATLDLAGLDLAWACGSEACAALLSAGDRSPPAAVLVRAELASSWAGVQAVLRVHDPFLALRRTWVLEPGGGLRHYAAPPGELDLRRVLSGSAGS